MMPGKEMWLAFEKRARTSPFFYLLLSMGLLFAVGSLLVDPVKHCVEYPCPIWLRSLIGGIGALFAVGAFSAIIRDFRFGSRLVPERSLLVWWEGYPPIKENTIAISVIKTIVLDSGSDNNPIILFDSQGKRIGISSQCIPTPYQEWAYKMKSVFPHIEVQDK
jgi:hypothetical protein